MSIDIIGLTKRFGSYAALDRVDLEVRQGELLALLGPSGSGKTTLLRIIAGLETPDDGRMLLNGEDALTRGPRDRQVGFVFQHYALFRHMTVFENVAFGLKVRPRRQRLPKPEIADRVHRLLSLVQLDWLADRYPNQLSGGQRQRIALARALAIEPRVLLLDEPFGALDAKVRKELRRWLRRLHDEMHITSVFVTHDQEEALELADRVVVMSQGRIEQIGSPGEVYDRPASTFVYGFLGDVNRLECRLEDGRAVLAETPALLGRSQDYTGPATAFIRPHDIRLTRGAEGRSDTARIRLIHSVGPNARVELDYAGQMIEAEIPQEQLQTLRLVVNDWVRLEFDRVTIFPKDGRQQERPILLSPVVNGSESRLL